MAKFRKFKNKISGEDIVINVDGIESYESLKIDPLSVYVYPILKTKAGDAIILDEKYTDFENDPDFKPS